MELEKRDFIWEFDGTYSERILSFSYSLNVSDRGSRTKDVTPMALCPPFDFYTAMGLMVQSHFSSTLYSNLRFSFS